MFKLPNDKEHRATTPLEETSLFFFFNNKVETKIFKWTHTSTKTLIL